jgi:hypothetical protein
MLYIALVPIVAVIGSLGAMSVLRAEGSGGAAPAAATPESRAMDAARAHQQALRRQYRECMDELGGKYPQRLRGRAGRFSPRPNMDKIREAAAMCQTLLYGAEPSTPARKPSAPPVL